MVADLNAGRCDLVMSGLTVTPDRMLEMLFSEPYMKATMSFVERDHVRAKFSSREAVKALKRPRIGMLDVPYYVDTLQNYLPQAEMMKLHSPGNFFRQRGKELDALFLSAERGSASGAIFLGLSGYAVTTRKDFSFMGGFLMIGIGVPCGRRTGRPIFAARFARLRSLSHGSQ